jgi:hypothetical protein
MQELLQWLFGRSARNAHIRNMAEKAIELLKKNISMEHQQLAKELGISFDKYQKPRRTFYFVVNPLKKVNLLQEKRVYIDKAKKKYETHYFLAPERFRGYMDRALDDFNASLK